MEYKIKFDKRCKDRTTKLCDCGCGTVIAHSNRNGIIKYVKGHEWRGKKRIGENRNQKGEINNNWKGGKIKNFAGYIELRCEGHPKAKAPGFYIKEHILIMEKQLGRYLKDNEVVHHINKDKTDNRIENLNLMFNGEHSSYHRKEELKEGKKLFGGK